MSLMMELPIRQNISSKIYAILKIILYIYNVQKNIKLIQEDQLQSHNKITL